MQKPHVPTAASPADRHSACQDCGTAIPRTDRLCSACAATHAPPRPPAWHTAVHWLILIVFMAALIGIATLFT